MGCVDSSAIVLSGVNFTKGTAQLTEEAKKSLTDTAKLLKDAAPEQKFEIAGYTDSSGSPAKNLAISQQRADAVRDFLASQGISKELMFSKGYGPANPLADNRTKQGQEKNRRVELHLQK